MVPQPTFGGRTPSRRSGSARVEGAGLRELAQQGQLAVDDGGEAADALADEVGGRVAERQPHRVAAAAVGVERGARRVRDELLHGARQHRLRVEVLGQGEPDVEAAVRHRPGERGQVLGRAPTSIASRRSR